MRLSAPKQINGCGVKVKVRSCNIVCSQRPIRSGIGFRRMLSMQKSGYLQPTPNQIRGRGFRRISHQWESEVFCSQRPIWSEGVAWEEFFINATVRLSTPNQMGGVALGECHQCKSELATSKHPIRSGAWLQKKMINAKVVARGRLQAAPNQISGRGFRKMHHGCESELIPSQCPIRSEAWLQNNCYQLKLRSSAASAQSDQRAWLQNNLSSIEMWGHLQPVPNQIRGRGFRIICYQLKCEVICSQCPIRSEGVASE